MENRQRQKGQGLIEYALILVLVAVVVIAILALLTPQQGNKVDKHAGNQWIELSGPIEYMMAQSTEGAEQKAEVAIAQTAGMTVTSQPLTAPELCGEGAHATVTAYMDGRSVKYPFL